MFYSGITPLFYHCKINENSVADKAYAIFLLLFWVNTYIIA